MRIETRTNKDYTLVLQLATKIKSKQNRRLMVLNHKLLKKPLTPAIDQVLIQSAMLPNNGDSQVFCSKGVRSMNSPRITGLVYTPKVLGLVCRTSAELDSHPNQLMTYGFLARQLGHCPDSKYLSIALGIIQEIDQANGKPLRSARVVRKDKKKPGKGFWECARQLGYQTHQGFWLNQVKQQDVTDFENVLM